MTPQSTVGEIVAITTINSEPLLLVSSVTDDHAADALLADLPTEPLYRLQASGPDTATRRQLAQTLGRVDDRISFTITHTDYALGERDSSCPHPSKEARTDGPDGPCRSITGPCDRYSATRHGPVATPSCGRGLYPRYCCRAPGGAQRMTDLSTHSSVDHDCHPTTSRNAPLPVTPVARWS